MTTHNTLTETSRCRLPSSSSSSVTVTATTAAAAVALEAIRLPALLLLLNKSKMCLWNKTRDNENESFRNGNNANKFMSRISASIRRTIYVVCMCIEIALLGPYGNRIIRYYCCRVYFLYFFCIFSCQLMEVVHEHIRQHINYY